MTTYAAHIAAAHALGRHASDPWFRNVCAACRGDLAAVAASAVAADRPAAEATWQAAATWGGHNAARARASARRRAERLVAATFGDAYRRGVPLWHYARALDVALWGDYAEAQA